MPLQDELKTAGFTQAQADAIARLVACTPSDQHESIAAVRTLLVRLSKIIVLAVAGIALLQTSILIGFIRSMSRYRGSIFVDIWEWVGRFLA